MPEGYSPMEGGGLQRTECHCHNCSKQFIAELDFDINGEHVIECPHCGHEHWRKIHNGKITEARWGSGGNNGKAVSKATVWKSNLIQAQTSTVSAFIRERWLNRSDCYGG
jgi:DNA-directed RNA polymerase subunit RPC12/RpoP